MKNSIPLIEILLLASMAISAQQRNENDPILQKYLSEQKKLGQSFSNYFYPDFPTLHSLPEKLFVFKIDSFRNIFDRHLEQYSKDLDRKVVTV